MKPLFALCVLLATSAFGQQNPSTMPRIGSVDLRFQSYNVEMVEVIGGRFWKPYDSRGADLPPATHSATPGGVDPSLFQQLSPVDLYNPRLRKLAAALGPAYIRVSGTWANTVYFWDSNAPAPAQLPKGFGGVLTRAEWKGVVDFSHAVDAKIVTSFATSVGTRDASGMWTPKQAERFLVYTDSIGGPIAAAEFMNEPTFPSGAGVPPGYDGAAYGRDFAIFKHFFREYAPHAILLGPGSVGEGTGHLTSMKLLPTKDMLTASVPNPVDVFSYHFYGAVSSRCVSLLGSSGGTSPNAALSKDWLSRTGANETFYAHLRDTYTPGKSIWLTETGQAACGGDRWASTFIDTFRYLDQMGTLAQRGVQVIFHNTLDASDYALIDGKTLTPRPDYWAALLWHDTMGTTVLKPGVAPSPSVHLYAQCMKDHPGGVTLLALNLDRSMPHEINIPEPSTRYTLTAMDVMGHTVELNGKKLMVSPDGSVTDLTGVSAAKGDLPLAPVSITVLTVPEAANPACR